MGLDSKRETCMQQSGLITTKWENPHPNTEIVSIDAVSLELGAVPIIVAISLGDGSLDVHPIQKMTITWGRLKNSLGN